jgi:hypothetical protein
MIRSLTFQVVTPIHSEDKEWEGRKYKSHTCQCLVELIDRQGSIYPTTVKVRVDETEVALFVPGAKFSLDPRSFFEKGGLLAFSPKLVPLTAAGEGTIRKAA